MLNTQQIIKTVLLVLWRLIYFGFGYKTRKEKALPKAKINQ
jgi:hypothetical protein